MVTKKSLIKFIKQNLDKLTDEDLQQIINKRFLSEITLKSEIEDIYDKHVLFDIFVILITGKFQEKHDKYLTDKIFVIINELAPIKHYDDKFDKLDVDSIDRLDIELSLEKEFNVEIIEDDFWKQTWSVNKLVEYVNSKYNEQIIDYVTKIINQ